MTAGQRWVGARVASLAMAVAFSWLLPEPAYATPSRICRQLEAELTASSGGSQARLSRKQESAIARQQEHLQVARRDARRGGCKLRLFGGSDSCKTINRKIEKMERNLKALERGRPRKAYGSGRSRVQIMAALRANGCRDQAKAEKKAPAQTGGARKLFDQIFGTRTGQNDSRDETAVRREEGNPARRVSQPENSRSNRGSGRYSVPSGRYRTLCVRTCDGYYFPISTASNPSDFGRDQANCQSSCPGTEVQIYYHRPSEESEAMVSSLDGRSYGDLPSAWLYKQPDTDSPAGCSCNRQQQHEATAYSAATSSVQTEPLKAHPGSKPDFTDAPKTLSVPSKEDNTTALREKRKIRVVGPLFLPDPEEAAGLPVPDQTKGP